MAEYLVRVEIFSADGDNYEELHKGMARLGFNRTVNFSDGSLRVLPIGTYVGNSSHSSTAIRDQVKLIADKQSSKGASVFVALISDWSAVLYSA